MIDSRPGFFWCEDCQEYIPDTFTDHKDQHGMASSDADSRVFFWVLCIAIGMIAGLIVTVLT